MLDPRGLVEGGGVGLALLACGLDAQQQRAEAARLAHHVGGLGIALVGAHGVDRAVLFHEGQGVERLGAGGDELGGEAGLLGVGRQQGGGLGDGGVVAADEVVGGVGDRRREGGAEAVGELVVHVPRELDGEVGVLEALHAGNVYLVSVGSCCVICTYKSSPEPRILEPASARRLGWRL